MYRCVRCGEVINSGVICSCEYNITSIPMRFAFSMSAIAKDLLSQAVYAEPKKAVEAATYGKNPGDEEYRQGMIYYWGIGTSRDYDKALVYLKQSAQKGNVDAYNTIAGMYYFGIGVQKDPAEAYHWYVRAAKLGSANAMGNLGWMYEHGIGVEYNYEESRAWYEAAKMARKAFSTLRT